METRLKALGLELPPALSSPDGQRLPFPMVQRHGARLLISGHGPQTAAGAMHEQRGKVGDDLTTQQGYRLARLVALSVLASIRREVGDLDRVRRWVRVFGMVNSGPGFYEQPSVINGFSDQIIELYGRERGSHARSAIGVAQLPFNIAVEVEGEVELFDDC
ncbi:RidA family protein [Frateuria aurantia]